MLQLMLMLKQMASQNLRKRKRVVENHDGGSCNENEIEIESVV
jgi:hypothetical protein